MPSLWYLCICLSLLGCSLAASDADFNAVLKLYSGAKYKNSFATIKFNYASRCYNLVCDSLNDKTASAKWDKIPTSSSDTLVFYSRSNCKGVRGTVQLSKFVAVRNFNGLAGKVSSFMVKTKDTTSAVISKRGKSNVCDWTSVGTDGILEEDPTLALSF